MNYILYRHTFYMIGSSFVVRELISIKKNLFTIFLIITLLVAGANVWSQNKNILAEKYSIENGLSQSNVRCILQDKFGFVWLGTQDGLNRFDGYEFVVYKHDPNDSNSISDNLVSCMIEDHDGNMWIGTSNGLNKFDPVKNRFERFLADTKNKDCMQGKSVLSLLEDKDGAIWAGTYLGGLSRYDKNTNKFTTYLNDPKDSNSLNNNSILAIYEDKFESIWVGTVGGGLDRFDKHTGKFYHYKSRSGKDTIKSYIVTSLSGDDDNLYIGTLYGLNIFNFKNQAFETFTRSITNSTGISSNMIWRLAKDKSGLIWIGTEDNGLDCFDPNTKKFLHNTWAALLNNQSRQGLQEDAVEKYIESILIDNAGTLWLGTHTSGVYKITPNPKKFEIYEHNSNNKNTISSNSIRAVFEDHLKNLWIGTDDGLNKIDHTTRTVERYFNNPLNPRSISYNKVWSFAEDKHGFIWVGTQDGLNKFDPSKKYFQRFIHNPLLNSSIPFNIIKNIHIDRFGMIWLGTFSYGLIRYDPIKQRFRTFSKDLNNPNTISDNVIFQMIDDRNGNLWVCTSQGLNKFDRRDKKFVRYIRDPADKNSLDVDAVYSILEDDKGNFWIGTQGGGLLKLDSKGKKIKSYNESDGLSNNIVYGILQDSKKNLWLSTNKGISKFNPFTEEFKNYDARDGLPSNEFNACAFLKSSSGKLFFGSIKGLVAFYPDSIVDNTNIPRIVITNFKIYEKPATGKKIFIDGDKIELPYSDNFFSFEFSALDFTEPSKNQYLYMLEGLDPGWVNAGDQHYASYTNLDPGRYTFRVKASNNDGVWNNKGIAIAVVIYPPFWKTWWFRIITAGIVLGLAFYFFERRVFILKKEKAIQQRFSKQLIDSQENERMRIASELHDSIGQNLIIIKNRAMLGVDSAISEIKNDQLKEIIDISSQTIGDVREISYNLRPYQLGKLGLTKAIESVIKKASPALNVNFNIDIENIDNTLSKDNEIHFYRIVQECLNNTIKHSKATGVFININKKGNLLTFSYSDNGIGFNPAGAGASESDKTGMGLFDIAERVKILGGTLNFDSAPNRGVKILIQITLEKE